MLTSSIFIKFCVVWWWIRRKVKRAGCRSITGLSQKVILKPFATLVCCHISAFGSRMLRNEVFHTQGNIEITFCGRWVARKKQTVFPGEQFLWNVDWKMEIFKESFGNRPLAWRDVLVFCSTTQCKPLSIHPFWKKVYFSCNKQIQLLIFNGKPESLEVKTAFLSSPECWNKSLLQGALLIFHGDVCVQHRNTHTQTITFCLCFVTHASALLVFPVFHLGFCWQKESPIALHASSVPKEMSV